MAAGAPVVERGAWRRVWEAIDERLGLSGLAYPVPAHANGLGYILGGITFFGFLILAATGVWLAQFYHPTPEAPVRASNTSWAWPISATSSAGSTSGSRTW